MAARHGRHVNMYEGRGSPAANEALGAEWRGGRARQDNWSTGSELESPVRDRGRRSDPHRPADITDPGYMRARTSPDARNPYSSAARLYRAGRDLIAGRGYQRSGPEGE